MASEIARSLDRGRGKKGKRLISTRTSSIDTLLGVFRWASVPIVVVEAAADGYLVVVL